MVVKKALSYYSFSLVNAIISLITVVYLTRVLVPEEYGFLGLFAVLVFFMSPLIGFNAMNLVGVNYVSLDRDHYHKYRNAYVSFALVIFAALAVLTYGVAAAFMEEYLFLSLLTLFIALNRFLTAIHSAELVQEHRAQAYGVLNSVTVFIILLATVVFVSLLDMSWEGRLLAVFFVELVMVVYRLYRHSDIGTTFRFAWDRVEIRQIVIFGFPMFFALVLSWVIFQSDTIIVLNFFSLADVGLYTVAYALGAFLKQINQAVTNAVVPKIYKALREGRGGGLIRKYNLYYSSFILAIAALAALFFHFFADLILGDAYAGAGGIIGIIAFAFAFNGIYGTSGLVLNYYKMNVLKSKMLFVCAASNLILSLLLIPILGLTAPAWGTLLSFVILAGLSYVYSRKIMLEKDIAE